MALWVFENRGCSSKFIPVQFFAAMAFMQHLTNGLVSFYDTLITEAKENNAVLKFVAIFASAILFIYW